MASIEDVAKLAKPALGGINWDELAKKPPDASGNPGNSIWNQKQYYYFDYMRPAGLAAMKVVDTLDIDISSDQAFTHFENLYSAVKTVKNIAWETALEGLSVISRADNEMKVTVETLRAAVAICWYTALFGAEMHRTAAMQAAWRQFSDEEIVEHAVLTTAMFECITSLDKWGVLKSIKKGGTAGFGIAPVAAALIGIGLVIAIAIIAFMVIAIMDVSSKNRALKSECAAAREAGDSDMYDRCINALSSPQNSIATEIFKNVAQTATPWIVGGGLLVMGVAFMPTIVRKIKEARRVARE